MRLWRQANKGISGSRLFRRSAGCTGWAWLSYAKIHFANPSAPEVRDGIQYISGHSSDNLAEMHEQQQEIATLIISGDPLYRGIHLPLFIGKKTKWCVVVIQKAFS